MRGVCSMKTRFPRKGEVSKSWHLVDANGKVLGRLASRIAGLLTGKHKTLFSSHLDVGDHVVVINAEKVRVTGNKENQKVYYRHSQYPGGLKAVPYSVMLERYPERVIRLAVKGMLPNNKLREVRLKKLKVYRGDAHPHQGQGPRPLEPAQAKGREGTQSP